MMDTRRKYTRAKAGKSMIDRRYIRNECDTAFSYARADGDIAARGTHTRDPSSSHTGRRSYARPERGVQRQYQRGLA